MPIDFQARFSQANSEQILRSLTRPSHHQPADVIMDTDASNEIDDQFAIAYLIKSLLGSEQRLSLKSFYAAPYVNEYCADAATGMKRSYEEIFRILELMPQGNSGLTQGSTELIQGNSGLTVLTGAECFHPDENTPVSSPAAHDLASRAMAYTPECPLYVIAAGAITNITSALLLNPDIRDRIVVIWLGGCAHHWPHNREFNLRQDIAGARVLFGCGVPLVQVPAHGMAGSFATTGPELEYWLRGKNQLCDYLIDNTIRRVQLTGAGPVWSRAIWDVVPVAWLIKDDCLLDYLTPSPIPEYDHKYSFAEKRHPIRYVYHVYRDKLFTDLFTRLADG